MPEPINIGRIRIQEKAHRIHIACSDRERSEQDLLHRFVAQLKLPNFQIAKVNIHEVAYSAKIGFWELQNSQADSDRFASLFKWKKLKSESQLTLNLDLYKLDTKGLSFFIDYEFECRSRQTAHHLEIDLGGNVHAMVQTAFEGYPSFSISSIPDVEMI